MSRIYSISLTRMSKKHGLQVGIEAKIEYHQLLEDLGTSYESWRRSAINWMQSGLSEEEVEKRLQSEFNLQWAWADSIATVAKQCCDQLATAKDSQINQLKDRIKAKTSKARTLLKELEKRLKKPFKTPVEKSAFGKQLMGLKSKVLKIESLRQDLYRLESTERLHICFGSRKLFNAQYHLEENGYENHAQWLTDWRKKRSGRFYCIGKGQYGGGTMMKVFATDLPNTYRLEITVPRPLQEKWGEKLGLHFEVSDRDGRTRRADLNYALECQKPITIQVFRREHKQDGWYVHLTTYVPHIPIVHSIKNGCLGIDFNAETLSLTYVKPDGNITWCQDLPYQWKGLSSGQRAAMMRDLVCQIVKIAESLSCAIAIESLDFSKKKAGMSEESKLYNEMLSNLAIAVFRDAIQSRCRRFGVQLIQVSPAFTSIIGTIKFMARYGLNSGTAAAMAIARRAMRLREKLPKCLARPEDLTRHDWSGWNHVARFLKRHRIRRTRLFQWTKALEGILTSTEVLAEHSPSLPVDIEMGESKNPCHSPMDKVSNASSYVQLCLGF